MMCNHGKVLGKYACSAAVVLAMALIVWLVGVFWVSGAMADQHAHSDQPALKPLTPEALWEIGRVSAPRVSPDGSQVLFAVKQYDLQENSGQSHLYVADLDGGNRRRVSSDQGPDQGPDQSTEQGNDDDPSWRPDGDRIGFLHQGQIWEMNPDGGQRRQISTISSGVSGFAYSPTQENILFSSPVPRDTTHPALFADLDKAKAVITDELMYRHWDAWVETFTHLHVATYADGEISEHRDIMTGLDLESPFRPFGGMEQVAWSPDGRSIAYAARSTDPRHYALSTNSRIMLYELDTGKTRALSKGSGYDLNPAFSPDGKRIAWISMERDGYEADKSRLMALDLDSGFITDLTTTLDQDVHEFVWSRDGEHIYFTSPWHGSTQIYRLDPATREISPLTSGRHTFSEPALAGPNIVALKSSLSRPEEVFYLDVSTRDTRNISRVNNDVLASFHLGEVREHWLKTVDQRDMLTLVVLPPDFAPENKYPALLYCVGGPEGAVDHSWSYRWNLQTLAARGFVVVGPNRRGAPGFGQRWKEAVLGDWGGLPMRDLLTGIDEIGREPWVDTNRLAAIGPSFGGFSVYWLAGHHDDRFKTLVAHDGIFNLESMYTETDELFFVNSEFGGPYWEQDNPVIQNSYAASPHRFVQNWTAPILVVQGGQDFRVPESQGLSAFNAARLQDIPARLLYFPHENHWVLSPQNSVLWYRTVLDWLEQWTGNADNTGSRIP